MDASWRSIVDEHQQSAANGSRYGTCRSIVVVLAIMYICQISIPMSNFNERQLILQEAVNEKMPSASASSFINAVATSVADTILVEPRIYEQYTTIWDFDEQCFDMLYQNTSSMDCHCPQTSDPQQAGLVFLNDSNAPMVYDDAVLPIVIEIAVMVAGSHPCVDILEGTFHCIAGDDDGEGAKEKSDEVIIPARIVGNHDGTYSVSAVIFEPGTYELQVQLTWRGYVPRQECLGSPCRFCYQLYHYKTIKKAFVINGPTAKDERMLAMQPCQTFQEILDGRWQNDPTQLAGFPDISAKSPTNYGDLKFAWIPNTCQLNTHEPQVLLDQFKGKHLHFIGDSTMFELMLIVMQHFWPDVEKPPHDRTFDSLDKFTTRFSFNWAGSPSPFDNHKGLPSLIGNDRFIDSLQPDADFIIIGAGAHERVGRIPVDKFEHALGEIYDLILERCPKIAQNPEHLIYRPAHPYNPELKNDNSGSLCNEDGNGPIRWMNLLAIKKTLTYGFAVMDTHRMFMADDYLRMGKGQRYCDDGHHCARRSYGPNDYHCDKCVLQGTIFVHYIVERLKQGEALR